MLQVERGKNWFTLKMKKESRDIGYFHKLKENHKLKYWFGYFFLGYPGLDEIGSAEYY